MSATVRSLALITISALLAIPLAATAQIRSELESIVRNAALGQNGIAGVSVIDLNTGTTLYEHRASEPLAPASNMKLFTSAAAVEILGPDFTFQTDLSITADGTVVLIGSGDPALADPEVTKERSPSTMPSDLFGALASVVHKKTTRVKEVVVDDRVFERKLIHPDWPTDQLERWYCAPVAGVNVHSNVLAFYPNPGTPDTGTTVDISPLAPWLEVENLSRRVYEGRNAVWIQRSGTDEKWSIRGTINVPTQVPIEVSIYNPALFMGKILADRLSALGVLVGTDRTPYTAVRLAGEHESFEFEGPPLARHVSTLEEILHRVNYDSHNMYAEALLKRMGYAVTGEPGSWDNGPAVIRMLIAERLGPDHASSTIIRDGSGLSRENRVRADTVTAWLFEMYHNDDTRTALLASLPTAENKLGRRFRLGSVGNEVYAKTGTINHVRCLSGYIINPETGQGAAFSFLLNGLTTGDSIASARNLHRDLVECLDRNINQFPIPAEPANLGG